MLDPYLRAALQKGVPPLFTDLRSLYDDPERVTIIEKLMNRYLTNLEETGHLCEEGQFSEVWGRIGLGLEARKGLAVG